MNDIVILNRIESLLSEGLKDVKLEKPNDEDVDDFELVRPAINIGWIPPKNFPNDYGYTVPGVIIALDNGKEDVKDTLLSIRLIIQTYDPGLNDEGILKPNTKGYTDILNLITKIRLILNESPAKIGISVEKPIEWGFYDEQNYPYWTGNMEFNVKIGNLPDINELL